MTSGNAAAQAIPPIAEVISGSAPQKLRSELGAVNSDTELIILPDPVGWRLLIALPTMAEKLASGLYIPDEVNERERAATVVGRVLAMGSLCYQDPKKYGIWDSEKQTFVLQEPWCKVDDTVLFSRYSGMRFRAKDGESGDMVEYRMLNDDEIMGTVPAGAAVGAL